MHITRMSLSVFLNIFSQHGSTVLHKTNFTLPVLNADPFEFEKLFKIAGFNGCLGSSDETHVGMLACAFWAQINHIGPKMKRP